MAESRVSSKDEQKVAEALEAFDERLEEADASGALATAEKALERFPEQADLHHARGLALARLEQFDAAADAMLQAVALRSDDVDLLVILAEIQSEALRFEEAEQTIEKALAQDPEHAHAHWLLGFLLDRRGAEAEGRKEFTAAARLTPEEHFVPVRFSPEEFDGHVEAALAEIPSGFRSHLENIEVATENAPSDALLQEQRFSPFVLGLFLGTPATEHAFDAPDLPPRVVIYQRNLENTCRTRDELVHEIGITVRHEIGHALGMDECEIEDAGHG